ncbi:hypothetical protein M5D96_011911 [Drosophila gunungcola]|uniref:Uncharacterized protein n=1 Tax=Drosophila gunungcola TaxID=103775 RepID=A0A9Q0BKY6_9MUSC|nr:hypothetical protein M5D96_011911 [Drosophila gunungcola]
MQPGTPSEDKQRKNLWYFPQCPLLVLPREQSLSGLYISPTDAPTILALDPRIP